jgi:hypothetical protein
VAGVLSRATTAHKLEEDLQKKQFVLVVPVKRILVSVNVSLNFLLIVSFLVRQVEVGVRSKLSARLSIASS